MTFYIQSYPHRRMARRWAEDREGTLAVNLRQDEDAYILSAFVPGVKSEDLSIQVLEDVVHIQVRSSAEDGGNYLIQELSAAAGTLTRTLRLPAPLDAENVEADVTDGVLTLRLPKAESARPRQIKIQAK